MNKQELRKRLELTPGEIRGVIRRNLKKHPDHNGYPLRMIVAQAQLNKVLNDPDLAIPGDRGFIYLTDLKEKRNGS